MIRGQTPADGDEQFYEEKSLRQKIEALLDEPTTASRKTAPAKKTP
jgi:hypothetical protein